MRVARCVPCFGVRGNPGIEVLSPITLSRARGGKGREPRGAVSALRVVVFGERGSHCGFDGGEGGNDARSEGE